MSPRLAKVTLAALIAAVALPAVALFERRFASGAVYPDYSSLRSDPMGARLLFDSLALIPGAQVERNYQPLEFLPDGAMTVLMLAADPEEFGAQAETALASVERAAARGNRIAVTFRLPEGAKTIENARLTEKWRLKFGVDAKTRRLYFAQAEGWKMLLQENSRPVAIERAFGTGSVALFTFSYDFSNGALVGGHRLEAPLLAIGQNTRVVFDEQHLGIADSGSVVGLARRFHLMGAAFGLALCAAAIVWRKSADFPPPRPASGAAPLSGRTSHAGLITLLARHMPRAELAGACWQEWLNTNRGRVTPEKRERAEAVLRAQHGKPLDALREIQSILNSKGEL